ncbi:NUDIX domain-containing protein [Novosphingobium sp. FSY-8]|uniref:NUDIX domain-containing protein n=1 Tax=Novosphingobium ovatum TaxID=1908523 RepID=A0ABW9XAD2_9SPHN|nr:NUDIX domain-containing protein [Novosphingobium ovatum]NBC35477.1 NUDIX domain-containing protein [Novosphingobium ovatum]
MSHTPDENAPWVPAATLVIFRHGAAGGPPELLMVQRARAMRFAGGACVFPGGRVDPADMDLAATLASAHPAIEAEDMAGRIAAIRETLEETGLAVGLRADNGAAITAACAARARDVLQQAGALAPMLTAMGWQVLPDALVPFARWRSNPVRRFDTRFYLIDIGTGAVDIAADTTENTRAFWSSAADTLRGDEAGELSVIFPTRRNLERLARFACYADAADHARATPMPIIRARIVQQAGEEWLTIPEGLGYPVVAERMALAKRG